MLGGYNATTCETVQNSNAPELCGCQQAEPTAAPVGAPVVTVAPTGAPVVDASPTGAPVGAPVER